MEETSLALVDEPSNPHSNGLGCLNERMLVAVMPLSQNPIAFRHGRGSTWKLWLFTRSQDTVVVRCYPGFSPALELIPAKGHNGKDGKLSCKNKA